MKYHSLNNISDISDNEDEYFGYVNNKKYIKYFLNFPFNEWIRIVGNIYTSKVSLIDTGKEYQRAVNTFLKENIFQKFPIECEDGEKQIVLEKGIIPDFLVKDIKFSDLQSIISERNYMFQYSEDCNYIKNSPKEEKVIIVGEICTKSTSKKKEQIKKYCEYIMQKKNYILMLIFDFNYEHLFSSTRRFNNLVDLADNKIPIIFGYIPKLFREDFYKAYNIISSEEKKIQYEFETLKKKSESSEEEIHNLKDEKAILEAKVIKQREEIVKLEAQNLKNKERIDKLEAQNLKNKERIDKLEAQKIKIKEDIEKLEKLLLDKEESDEKHNEEIMELKREIEEYFKSFKELGLIKKMTD